MIGPRYTPVARALVDAARLRPGDDALELGTGLVSRLAAPRVRSLLATDVAPGMLDVARRSTRRYPHVRFALVDYGNRLPFLDASFDVVPSGLTYVQESGDAVKELARVLKPRGRVALTMWGWLRRAGLERVERRDFDLTNHFASVDEYIEYRRGSGRPVGASSAFYERYSAAVRRRAQEDAGADGRFGLGWTLSVITARR